MGQNQPIKDIPMMENIGRRQELLQEWIWH
jgi:hypothetical protein